MRRAVTTLCCIGGACFLSLMGYGFWKIGADKDIYANIATKMMSIALVAASYMLLKAIGAGESNLVCLYLSKGDVVQVKACTASKDYYEILVEIKSGEIRYLSICKNDQKETLTQDWYYRYVDGQLKPLKMGSQR